MESNLTEKLARLPDGQLVGIEMIHSDGYASVRRVEAEWSGRLAICLVAQIAVVGFERGSDF